MASLESLWKSGREGTMSPLEQLRAWALFTVQKEDGGEEAVNYAAIAARVTKVGGGEPTRAALRQHILRGGLRRRRPRTTHAARRRQQRR